MQGAVGVLFFVSGTSGLVYEVLWAKYLGLSLGSTAPAQAAVMALYLGGLACGYALLGRAADLARRPLALYGLLELGICVLGALGAVLPDALAGRPYLLACAMVLPCTVLMGGTLPALAREAAGRIEGLETPLARLYAVNAAGAALGALLADFLLIPGLGLDLSVLCASGLNLACGAAALALQKRLPDAPPMPRAEAAGTRSTPSRLALAAAFVSGAAALSYETAWTRVFALALGSSVYSFALMLASFIGGVALGSRLCARKLLPRLAPFPLLGMALIAAPACALAVLPLYGRLPHAFMVLASWTGRTPSGFYLNSLLKLLACSLLTVPATACLGAALPLAARASSPEDGGVGSGVGVCFAWNTAGNVLGAAASGLWLLPALGIRGLIESAAFLQLAAGSALLLSYEGWPARRRLGACALALLACLAMMALSSWDRALLASGAFRRSGPAPSWKEFRSGVLSEKMLFYKDDPEGTVTVTEDASGTRYLKVNGKTDASSGADMATQSLLAHIPLMLRPGSSEALVIGFGSGVTAGSALLHPIRRLDAVEISPAVVEASGLFKEFNRSALGDPRLRLFVEDAKTFLARPGPAYDAIISEPSNPWIAGMGNLFTADFYRKARSRLKPRGLMVQWCHLYEMRDSDVRLVLRTFASVFESVTLWNVSTNDILLVGSRAPLEETLGPSLSPDAARGQLASMSIRGPAALLALQSATDERVREMAGKGRLHEDRFPILDYEAPKSMFLDRVSRLVSAGDERFGGEGLLIKAWLRGRGRPLGSGELSDLEAYDRRYGTDLAARAKPALLISPFSSSPSRRRGRTRSAPGSRSARSSPGPRK
jgi:spermidine synthase